MISNDNWKSGFSELFDLYVEVGEVKLSDVRSNECRFVECWISSCFHRNCARNECRDSKRRPIYEVIEEIESLCRSESSCGMIMEDENENAVRDWYQAIYYIVKYLKRIENIKAIILYTKQTKEEIEKAQEITESSEFEQHHFGEVYSLADVCVTRMSNVFSDARSREIVINNPDTAFRVPD